VIILASGSPRRTHLLTLLGIAHQVDPADIDESPLPGESPRGMADRLARAKAQSVAARHPGALVLAADTVVVLAGELLGKPEDPADARRMVRRLAGREHTVMTAVALVRDASVWEQRDETRVWFRPLTDEMIADYVATGEPLDKAGAYGLQGYGSVLIERIEGDCFGVMGLPVRLVIDLLVAAGETYRFTR
jgi:septum formation protein